MPTFDFDGPDGNVYSVEADEGTTQAQAQEFLGTLSPEQLKDYLWETPPEATVMERMMLGFDEVANITGNLGDYMVSHYPALATRWEPGEGGFLFAEDQYGEDFYELTPQERRDRISEVDTAKIQKEHANAIAASEAMAARGETDVARMVGGFGKAVADPATLVPVFGQAGKVKAAATAGQKFVAGTKAGVKGGALFGGAYEASEGLKESGEVDPMDVAKGAGVGAVAGGTLGGAIAPLGAVVTRGGRQKARIAKAKKSVSKADKLQKDYQENVLLAKAEGMSGADAHKYAREQLGLNTRDLYDLTSLTQTPIKTPTTAINATEELAARNISKRLGSNGNLAATNPGLYSTFIRPIDTRIRELSAPVFGRIMELEQRALSGIHKYHKEMVPLRKTWRKIGHHFGGKADKEELGLAMMNSNFKRARAIVQARVGDKGLAAFDRMVTGLKALEAEAKSVGIKFDTISNYFPRSVKDLPGLKNYLGSQPVIRDKLSKALSQAAKEKGIQNVDDLPEEDVTKIINRLLQQPKQKVRKELGATKERRIDTINKEILKFYDDPITAIDLHIRDMTAAIERRRMFGDSLVETKHGLEKVDESVGKLLTKMGYGEDKVARGELMKMLTMRFGPGEQAGDRGLQTLRQGTAGLTLGNPVSAVLNLADVGITGVTKGVINTIRGIPKAGLETIKGTIGIESKDLNADNAGWMLEMAQEISTGGRTSNFVRRAGDAMIRYGGFKLVDRFGKNITIQASLRKAQGQLKTKAGTRRFLREWGQVYDPQELQALMLDLKNKNVTDIVKAHIFSEVAEIQPLTRSQMPQKYLEAPNGRAFYQFKTWGLRQLEVTRQRVVQNLKSPDPMDKLRGAQQAVLLFAYVGGAGVGAKELQNWMRGRDSKITNPAELGDEMFWALMGNILFDRYNIGKVIEQGDAKGIISNYLTPPSLVIPGEIAVDAARGVTTDDPDRWDDFVKSTGGFGRMIQNLFMGGAEEYNKKLKDERREKVFGREE